jgi:hypothetical protein
MMIVTTILTLAAVAIREHILRSQLELETARLRFEYEVLKMAHDAVKLDPRLLDGNGP